MSSPGLLGAVLAGGESKRFGRDKAVEIIAGKSLVARAAETLAEVFDHVVIVSSHQPATGDWPHLPDVREGQGPLAGIESALLHAKGLGLEGIFALACDLPLVDASDVRAVVRAAEDQVACAPSVPDRGVQPLCAVYRLACLPIVSDSLDRGVRSVRDAFAAVGGLVAVSEADNWLNVNRPEDAERARALVARGRPAPL